jgi:hypothetical protein
VSEEVLVRGLGRALTGGAGRGHVLAGLGILVAADHLLLMRAGGCPVLDRGARLCLLLLLGLGSGLGLEGGGTARLLRLGSRDPEAAQKCDRGSGAEPLAANHHQSP